MTDPSKGNKTRKDAWFSKDYLVAGRYKLKRPLGSGGWGQVYLAKDQELGRRIAIKRLLPSLVADPEAVSRFHREASVVASIQDPNVLTIFDIIQEGDDHYIVMEYADAGTLSQALSLQGFLAPFEALSVAMDICKGLRAVHSKGIIHRDIKPANVMFFSLSDGFPLSKLGDFGIAVQSDDPRITANNTVLGTLIYLAPELASRFSEPTPASDIYSLGALIYEMMTGELDEPFFLKRIGEQSKLQGMEHFAMLPEPLQLPLFRLLQYRPAARLQSADEALQALKLTYGRLTASLATQHLLEQTVAEMTHTSQPTTSPSVAAISPSSDASAEKPVTEPKSKALTSRRLVIALIVTVLLLAASILSRVFNYDAFVMLPTTSSSLEQSTESGFVVTPKRAPSPSPISTITRSKLSSLITNSTSISTSTPSSKSNSSATPISSATSTASATTTASTTPTSTSIGSEDRLTGPISLGLTLRNTGIRGDEVIQVSPEAQDEAIEYQEGRTIWGEVKSIIGSQTFQIDRQNLNDLSALLPEYFSLEIEASPMLLDAIEKKANRRPGIYARRGDFWIGQIRCGSATPPDTVKDHTLTVRLFEEGQLRAEKTVAIKIITNLACRSGGKKPTSSDGVDIE